MASFITRVELHGATSADYERLHEYMFEALFYRAIRADDGTIYRLPTAEYHSVSDLSVLQVRQLAVDTAAKTGKKSWVLVAETQNIAWVTEQV